MRRIKSRPNSVMRGRGRHQLISTSFHWCHRWFALDSRQDGRQREELGGQVGQVDQQEDEERLDDANLLGEASDEAEDDGKDQADQSPSDADDEEGGWRGRNRSRDGEEEGRRKRGRGNQEVKEGKCEQRAAFPQRLTYSFETICGLNVLGSDFDEGDVDLIEDLHTHKYTCTHTHARQHTNTHLS